MENFVVIEISKEKIGFKFTMKTLELICEKQMIEFHAIAEFFIKKPFAAINSILQCANYVFNRGKNLVDTYVVDDWIEEMSQDDLQAIWDCFEHSLHRQVGKVERATEDEKKN